MLNDKIWVYCFKDKKPIDVIDCSFKKSGQFKYCYLYNRICRNLYGHNRYKSLGSPEAESIKEILELIKAGEEIFMLSTIEMIKFLEDTYGLDVSRELIFKYANQGLLSSEKKRVGQPGKGLGVKTYWPEATPGKVFVIKELLKQNFKLAEITKYYLMFIKGYLKSSITDELDLAKYNRVVKYFLFAEAGINFNEHEIKKTVVFIAVFEPEINDSPVGAPSGRVQFITGNKPYKLFKTMEFHNGVYKVKEENKILYS